MKMAKPSERDIDAAGNLMTLLNQIDRDNYPNIDETADVPAWFDADNFEHLRALYDAVKATLDKGPGYPGRVIGGMCYVIMYEKNEIVDPASDTIDLHPKLVKALKLAEDAQTAKAEVERLTALLNTPETLDFIKGLQLETAHQRERWSISHDAGKAPADWFWLIGYLAQKAMMSHLSGDVDKALHHTITTAAALVNWHAAILGKNDMRPGISPPADATAAADAVAGKVKPLTRCAAGDDADCTHAECPQLRDGEPAKTGRHCPLDTCPDED